MSVQGCGPHGVDAQGSRQQWRLSHAGPSRALQGSSGLQTRAWLAGGPPIVASCSPFKPTSPPEQATAIKKQGPAPCCLEVRPRGGPLSVRGAGPGSPESGLWGRRPQTPGQLPSSPTPAWCHPSSGATLDFHVPILDSSAGHRCPFCPVPSPQDKAAAEGGSSLNSHSKLAAPIRRGVCARVLPQQVPVPGQLRAGPALSQTSGSASAAPASAWARLLCPLGPQRQDWVRDKQGTCPGLRPPSSALAAECAHLLCLQKPQGGAVRCSG